jgi:hypothetical protein
MPLTKDQLFAEAMALNARDREALAARLLLSVGDKDQAAVDSAWLEEARRREAEFARGNSSTSPVEDVLARLQSRAPR